MIFCLKIFGDVCGLIGSLLIFFFGIPRKIDTEGKNNMVFLGEDHDEIKKIERYKILGNFGISLIALSFVCMLFLDFFGAK